MGVPILLGMLCLVATPAKSTAVFSTGATSGLGIIVREGGEIDGWQVTKIRHPFVFLSQSGQTVKIKAGDSIEEGAEVKVVTETGLERTDDSTIVLTEELKNHLIDPKELPKVLMAAASEPYFENGNLRGFSFWEIDKGSFFDQIGMQDGDIVTSINGIPITDVVATIKLLQSLKTADEFSYTYLRSGVEKTVNLVIR